ncbi:G-type lectin S-receptor-like serine/threonine-protein kinase At2g19130 [Mangifera indica]|uniref:G-type lectin S-receptor-like serine/threonine-protein kinase At2g19130 n=1 Tax=Mangifera indica TaxID=29780 RepID=UPI001CFA0E3C|nr:G-type lectin S-receptor-like serine/threonine-protein kinase At2g19130 [Mangifera indica]
MHIMNNSWFALTLLFICFSPKSYVSLGADTISANQTLSGDQTIASAHGDFVLGFFKPGQPSNYYLCMWYGKVSVQNVVWVANRENPISDKYSSVLRISDGKLVLFNESKVPIWSTNLNSTTANPLEVVLLDEGNLVLRELSGNSSKSLWESFDHPSHTWIPGMRMRLDKRTNIGQRLISWKNTEDPAPGLFSLELDPNGSNAYFILWNGSRSHWYWSSGPWNENEKLFEDIPEMRASSIYDFNYHTDENESYFIYSLKNTSPIISRFLLDVTGQVKQMNWLESTNSWLQVWAQPRQNCEVYAICGAFGRCTEESLSFCDCLQGFEPSSEQDWNLQDYSGGCARKTQLQCQNNSVANGKKDKFVANSNMVLPKNPQSVPVGSGVECERTCLNDCSCTAYAYEDSQCSVWFQNLLGVRQLGQGASDGKTLFIKLAPSEFSSPKSETVTVIGGILGSVALAVLLGLVVFVYLRRRKNAIKTTKALEGSLTIFAYKDLQNATKNFSEKLGGGGFGFVFKGVLPNSSVIAVKKLESLSQGEKQFRSEVSTVGTIQHVNVVRLLGFCCEGTKRLLVYDYMPNGSLNSHLFHTKGSNVLDWKTRCKIALGSARGLAYLHEKCRDHIIHCDIKPENILLDVEFCPKVADFGLAKLVGRDFSRVLTTIRGTRGYLAPEWISGVAITTKADVYSYGMMLFELVSGRRNSEQFDSENSKFFPTWVATAIIEGVSVLKLLDSRLEGNADVEEVLRICRVACWCIQDDETQRPSMGQVVQMLEGVLEVTQYPIPRSIEAYSHYQDHINFFTTSTSNWSPQSQNNNISATSS